MTITRTVSLNDITPQEAAELFAAMFGEQQAAFFAEVARIAKGWPGAGWCQQSCEIARHLDRDGYDAIKTLALHLAEERPS